MDSIFFAKVLMVCIGVLYSISFKENDKIECIIFAHTKQQSKDEKKKCQTENTGSKNVVIFYTDYKAHVLLFGLVCW